MNKVSHGAIMGLIIGSLSVLLVWTQWMSIVHHIDNPGRQHLVMIAWVIGYTAFGALLGALLPKHK